MVVKKILTYIIALAFCVTYWTIIIVFIEDSGNWMNPNFYKLGLVVFVTTNLIIGTIYPDTFWKLFIISSVVIIAAIVLASYSLTLDWFSTLLLLFVFSMPPLITAYIGMYLHKKYLPLGPFTFEVK